MGGKTSTASKTKYNAKAYDRLYIVVPKGGKDEIRQAAETAGQSVNAWINDAINDKLALKTKETER